MPKGPEENCASKSHQHSWAVMNLWLCNRLFWGYELLVTGQPTEQGRLSHTQGNWGSLADQ